MKLNFSHSGRQFFFITLVVAEWREVLSRVVDERKIAFMVARLREARAAANEAAVRGELKVTKGLRFGERVGGGEGRQSPSVPWSSPATATSSCRLTRVSSRRFATTSG